MVKDIEAEIERVKQTIALNQADTEGKFQVLSSNDQFLTESCEDLKSRMKSMDVKFEKREKDVQDLMNNLLQTKNDLLDTNKNLGDRIDNVTKRVQQSLSDQDSRIFVIKKQLENLELKAKNTDTSIDVMTKGLT